jgi:uncharacterized protein (DUF3820 family)
MTAEIVPFGKYKGQPVAALAADEDYCEWLTAQPWFRQKYGNVYNILIQGGAEPQDSPEHNQMQAMYLDDARCFMLADLLYPKLKGKYGVAQAMAEMEADPQCARFRPCLDIKAADPFIADRRFEDRGWDVTYEVRGAQVRAHCVIRPPLEPCSCKCDHGTCKPDATCNGGGERCSHPSHFSKSTSFDEYAHCDPACYWHCKGPLSFGDRDWIKKRDHAFGESHHGVVRAELKPDLGDDYPAVLRQVTGYPHDHYDRRCVVARRHAFEHVTWDQVRQIFAGSGIRLLDESELRRGEIA